MSASMILLGSLCFFFQAEDGIRDLVRSRGLGDVYKRQALNGHNDVETITLTANDGNGNTEFCTFTVTLKDLSLIHI